jgi:hypothetical protein
MNANKTKDGFGITKGMNFLGRSGVKIIKGLRVAYVSGLDFDALSSGTPSSDLYLGHYFTKNDLGKVHADY